MRIVLHDFPGHAFPVQLARSLAGRGHEVLHLHFGGIATPKGLLLTTDDDPQTLSIEQLSLDRPFRKHSFVRRLIQEREVGRILGARIRAARPDVVISGNGPLDVQDRALRAAHAAGAPFIFWLQDFYSVAIDRIIGQKVPIIGPLVTWRFRRLERGALRASDAVVAITPDFLPMLARFGVDQAGVHVLENWAPLDGLTPQPRDNAWAREHDLVDRTVVIYSGTLGLKHNPALLLSLADSLADDPGARLVVISEGRGADWLREHGSDRANLVLLPYQAFDRLAEVLSSADLLVAILEPDAGTFSVPSKVLSYLAIGRPIVGAIPAANLAARLIVEAGAGRVVDPADPGALARTARSMLASPERLAEAGRKGIEYANVHFEIDRITDRFEAIIEQAIRSSPIEMRPDPGRADR